MDDVEWVTGRRGESGSPIDTTTTFDEVKGDKVPGGLFINPTGFFFLSFSLLPLFTAARQRHLHPGAYLAVNRNLLEKLI